MSQAPVGTAGLVRVTVTSGTRRVDLVVPGAVPVAELVPELARSVGLLDPATVHGGYHLTTTGGHRLVGDAGLSLQGVVDGAVVLVTTGADRPPPVVHDDPAEAMADVVERLVPGWSEPAARRTSLAAAALLLAVGAVALVLDASALAAGVAAAVAVGLAVAACVLVRTRGPHRADAGVAAAWAACGYAAAVGLVLADGERLAGLRLAAAGAGLAVAGLALVAGLGAQRVLLAPAAAAGVVLAACGVLVDRTGVDPDVLLAGVLAFVVVVGGALPWLALGLSGAGGVVAPEEGPVDTDRLAADAVLAHQLMVAMAVTVGLLVVVATPAAVALGPCGGLLVLAAAAALVLRTRHHHAGALALVGLLSGLAAVVAGAVSAVVAHPSWRPEVGVVLALVGVAGLATATSSAPVARRGRWGDLLEGAALVAVVPLLVLAVVLGDRV